MLSKKASNTTKKTLHKIGNVRCKYISILKENFFVNKCVNMRSTTIQHLNTKQVYNNEKNKE